jgi:hypothetical protein
VLKTDFASRRKNVLTATRCKSDLQTTRGLSPVTGNPNPARASAHPMSWDPNSRGTWRPGPRARHPNVISSGPSPVAWCPNVTGTRRDSLRFNPHCWRRLRHHDVACHNRARRSPRGHLLRGRRSCRGRNRRRCFVGAANQCERRQRQHPNAYSHNIPFCNTFVSG